jgi:hypothetical protein
MTLHRPLAFIGNDVSEIPNGDGCALCGVGRISVAIPGDGEWYQIDGFPPDSVQVGCQYTLAVVSAHGRAIINYAVLYNNDTWDVSVGITHGMSDYIDLRIRLTNDVIVEVKCTVDTNMSCKIDRF